MQMIDSREFSEWIAEFALMPWGCDLAAIGHKPDIPQSPEEIMRMIDQTMSGVESFQAEKDRRFGNSSR